MSGASTNPIRMDRRALLGGLIASLPMALNAAPPSISARPLTRAGRLPEPQISAVDEILSQSGLTGQTGFVLRDLASGRVLEQHQPGLALPPASVAKTATTLYALRALGQGYRFNTRVLITGPVANGRVQGDLWLVGDGDPHMDSDGLADMVDQVVQAGIHGVTGRFHATGAALPFHRHIDAGQPEHVGYNPSIDGLNLNFNRVYFQWKKTNQGYTTTLSAKGERFDPAITGVDIELVDRGEPVFDYRQLNGRDTWRVARSALGQNGSRWLPVRTPTAYAAEVFRALGEAKNLRLPAYQPGTTAPQGREVASQQSAPLEAMLTSMLRYSTNLTAEVVGLRAAQKLDVQPASIAQSAGAMTDWMRQRYGLRLAQFVNHSGLTADSAMSAAEMVQILDIAAQGSNLAQLLKRFEMKGDNAVAGVSVRAKTGTLNFTRALAGYMDGSDGRRLGFAIFAADPGLRQAAGPVERPPGAAGWVGRARTQEQALLHRWALQYLSA